MTIRACILAALAVALLPATAGGATVSVTEETLSPAPLPHERATLLFEAGPGEDNIATIVPAGEENGKLRYEVRDLHVPLSAGPGCTGGGGPDVAATCLMPRSRPRTCQHLGCSDLGSEIIFRFILGDGDDELRATQIPADDGGGGSVTLEADGGTGDDQLYPGPTSDRLDPGPGSDTVRSNQGNDFVDAGDSPDGADEYDLRDGYDTISYFGAGQPVRVSIDSQANDGAAGEGDRVVDAESIIGTPGADTLVGDNDVFPLGPDHFAEALIGGGGGDVLIGGGGPDLLYAAPPGSPGEYSASDAGTHDLLRGGSGNDIIQAYDGNDRVAGGAGDDGVYGMGGADRAQGGKGRDYVDGGAEADRLSGGSGQDRLHAGVGPGGVPDGAVDRLDCGPSGHDHAFEVERRDRLTRCERVKAESY
jgi:Ca2+-binding RTX toxin-like protein